MRICVTNDDGVSAHGISVVARHLRDLGHEVSIVAPTDDRSGSGTGLGRMVGGDDIGVQRLEAIEDISVVAIDAPPAMCVLAALEGVGGGRPDVVVSGINHGPNLGFAVLHSGTVGAALTAQMAGVPGIAVSVGQPATGIHGAVVTDDDPVWMRAAQLASSFVERCTDWGAKWVPNLNIPSDWDGTGAVECTRLARLGAIQLSVSAEDRVMVRITSSADVPGETGGKEAWPVDMAVNGAGRPTITPLTGIGTADVDADEVEALASAVREG